ncbi:hypothetical protein [Photobacterium sp.]|uniref:hypothetical protein n=1 Tax=Photobacterium sp. TaxID=660 RepID=UPI00299E9D64|nr:hypothetical protein [Photobacterium sp.]MDX1304399.1 hypothetical protein [Photobacterium sp.]
MPSVNYKEDHLDSVLVISEEGVDHEGLTRLFNSHDFPVDIRWSNLQSIDLVQYGAIVHLTRSSKSLAALLGDRLLSIKEEEWLLIAGDDEDLHCTVELTTLASDKLRLFVRMLWARFNIA